MKNKKKLLKILKENIFVDIMGVKIKYMILIIILKEVVIIIWDNLCFMIEKNFGLVVKLKLMTGMILKNCHVVLLENMNLNISNY